MARTGVSAPPYAGPEPLRIAGLYALAAAAWILLSDVLVGRLSVGGQRPLLWDVAKGWLFVAGTALLLFVLLRRTLGRVRRAEVRLQATVDSLADGVLVVDARGRVWDANAAAARLLGLSLGELLRLGGPELLGRVQLTRPDGQPVRWEEWGLARALAGETVREEAAVARTPDGRQVDVLASAAPVRTAPGRPPELAVAVVRDVSHLRQLERMRDEFLALAAHELKTPIATVKGYAQLLERWAPGGHTPREGSAFRVLERQSDRLGRLVQELLEVSRLQLGRLALKRRTFDVTALAAEVLEHMRGLSDAHALRLDSPGPVVVDADPERIEHVLVNLLDNAIRYSPQGGRVTLAITPVRGEVVVSVEDDGLGIPLARQGQLFERFYRAHAGLPVDRSGLGVGLHVSREIIVRHGGRMWFESEEARGSRFSFSLSQGVAHAEGRGHVGAAR